MRIRNDMHLPEELTTSQIVGILMFSTLFVAITGPLPITQAIRHVCDLRRKHGI